MYKLKTNIIGNSLSSCPMKELIEMLKLIIISLILVWVYRQMFCQNNIDNNKKEYFTQQQKDDLKLKTLIEMLTSNCKPEYCNMYDWNKKGDIPDNMSVGNFSTSKGCCLIPNDFKVFLYERRCGNS